jgi:hypothetical protein
VAPHNALGPSVAGEEVTDITLDRLALSGGIAGGGIATHIAWRISVKTSRSRIRL